MSIKPEAQAEIILWEWLRKYGEVYFNRSNALGWKQFRVEGESTEIPDMVLITTIFGKEEAIAIEVKDGDDSNNIRKGSKIFDKYLLNYYLGKTKYFIGLKEIPISRFIVASQYSPFGHLFGYGDNIISNSVKTPEEWIDKNVPKLEYTRTKDAGRTLLHNYSTWRKDNKIKQCFSLGWLVSDNIFNFTEDELKIQYGMKGKPIIQGISWNTKLNRWSQSIIKL